MVKIHRYVAYYRTYDTKRPEAEDQIKYQRERAKMYTLYNGYIIQEIIGIERNDISSKIIQVRRAVTSARRHNATLLIARCGKLYRSAHFLAFLRDSTCNFVFADRPNVNQSTVTQLLNAAQTQSSIVSLRVRAALQERKARGVRLGNPNLHLVRQKAQERALEALKIQPDDNLGPMVYTLRASGLSLRRIADELNRSEFSPPYGRRWYASSVRNILKRQETS